MKLMFLFVAILLGVIKTLIKDNCQVYTEDDDGKSNSFLGISEDVVSADVDSEDRSSNNNLSSSTFVNDIENFDTRKIENIIMKDLGGQINSS